jgi:hypothetical protein
MTRWLVIVTYRTNKAGLVDVEHNIEELEELQDLIERGLAARLHCQSRRGCERASSSSEASPVCRESQGGDDAEGDSMGHAITEHGYTASLEAGSGHLDCA